MKNQNEMTVQKMRNIARKAEVMTDRKKGMLSEDDVKRVLSGKGLISHPVDAVIMAILKQREERGPRAETRTKTSGKRRPNSEQRKKFLYSDGV